MKFDVVLLTHLLWWDCLLLCHSHLVSYFKMTPLAWIRVQNHDKNRVQIVKIQHHENGDFEPWFEPVIWVPYSKTMNIAKISKFCIKFRHKNPMLWRLGLYHLKYFLKLYVMKSTTWADFRTIQRGQKSPQSIFSLSMNPRQLAIVSVAPFREVSVSKIPVF